MKTSEWKAEELKGRPSKEKARKGRKKRNKKMNREERDKGKGQGRQRRSEAVEKPIERSKEYQRN